MIDFVRLEKLILSSSTRDVGSGVSDEDIGMAERRLGVAIMGGYRLFLKRFGWGGVDSFELFGLGGPKFLDLVEITELERSDVGNPLPRHLIPIMNNGGGDLYCLDTSVEGDPPVVLWEHDRFSGPTAVGGEFVSWFYEHVWRR